MRAEDRLGYHVKRVEQELMAVKHVAIKPSGLTVPQYTALAILSQHPGASTSALARFALVTPQTMATIMANLDAKGLIVKVPDPYHLNSQQIELTAAGRKVLGTADDAAVKVERAIGEAFTAQERDTLVDLLARFSSTLEEQAAKLTGTGPALTPFRTNPS
ncbi:MarR family winged helix-turn-helix transcriptional regulator [Amycolatopsis nigrescens]|uniref:MarR family winged helix-turn-helix transcriptional regulator n=1 Tax=Amycolatopsis nigrescens TaxID=381445 RepID=UPI00037CBAE2|nr:MarR family winged helix-turn-helix transcriptional regulator [Amycolatopsis nigrescens]